MARIDLKKPPKEPPALGLMAAKLYYAGDRKLDDAAMAKLQDLLDENKGDNAALFWALVSMEALCQMFANGGDQVTSDRVNAFIKAQRLRYPELEAEALALSQDQSEQAAENARLSTGGTATKKAAPMFGAKGPAGTKRLSDLIPPTAVRPPMPRKK